MPADPRLTKRLNEWLQHGLTGAEPPPPAQLPEPPELGALVRAAEAIRRREGHPSELLGPTLAALLRDLFLGYLAERAERWSPCQRVANYLAGLIILEQYLTPADRPSTRAEVGYYLTQPAYLTHTWELPPELARQLQSAAPTIEASSSYYRRRQAGVALLAQAVQQWAAGAEPLRRRPAALTPLPSRPNESPPLTPYYVPRLELQTQLLAQLESGPGLVLVGLGGIGKSTLAAWLAHALAGDYPDGQLWLDAGGSVAEAQQRLGRSLGVTLTGATNAERAAQLRTLLAGRRLLLVLDNLWDDPELPHLRVVGPDSRLVATSRAYPAAARLQLPLLEVGRLVEAEAGHLLAGWLGAGEYGWLNQRLGGHPLALTLIAALVQSGQLHLNDLPAWLAPGQTELDPADTLNRCFDLSYTRLAVDDQLRLAELSCFTAHFDLAGAAAIWGLPQRVTQATLVRLRGQALVERTGPTFRLHDLVRDYARHKLAAPPAVATAAHRRHAVYFIRHYLYHPGVLDDDQATAPSLDEVWPEVVAGVDWAAQHEPRLAAIAVVLAHTERPALLAALGEPLLAAVESYATTTEVAERAVLAEMLADLALGQSGFEAAVALFDEASLLWQEQGNRLAASYVYLRQAGVQLLRADPPVDLIAVQQALNFLTLADLPTAATIETWRWLYYWFDALLSRLVRQPDCDLEIPVTLRQIAQKSGYDILIGRGWHLERLWWSAPGAARLQTDRQQQEAAALSVESWRAWRRGGEQDKADREVTWSRYELRGQFSRRTARRYGRRLSRLTPNLTTVQQQLLTDPALRWWVSATETQRLAWFGQMYPRYLGMTGQRPLFPRGRAWVEAIEGGSAWGVQTRRWGMVNLSARSELEQAEWFLFSGIKPMPLLDISHQRVAVAYLVELSQ